MSAATKIAGFTAKVAFGFAMGMAVTPVFADVATWFPEAHNEENLRIKALQNVAHPYTGWIPRHMGYTEEPGLLTPFMDLFIGEEVKRLERLKAEAQEADALRDNFARQQPAPDSSSPPTEDQPSNENPFGEGALGKEPSNENPFGEGASGDSYLSSSFSDTAPMMDENSVGGAADLLEQATMLLG